MSAPLAERLRPKTLNDVVGQPHLVGENGVLSKLVSKGVLPSLILWGPPGTGKTTISRLLAEAAGKQLFMLSAVSSGVKDIKEVIQSAKMLGSAVLFIDEIHRFNKSQQDSLLQAVEDGTLTLIGATTDNPSFEVNNALISRMRVFTLNALSPETLEQLLRKAHSEDSEIAELNVSLQETDALIRLSGGDARILLNTLELAAKYVGKNGTITNEQVFEAAQQKTLLYDKNGDEHYDVISAFIKSIRGSDPNAALYWLARMMEGGEDPKFIARRLLILASEDIGNANPNALLLATSAFQAVTFIGYPECDLILSQTVIYLASSPKSNSAYTAIRKAQAEVKKSGNLPVPIHLRNAPTKLLKEMSFGKDYQYPHDFEGNFTEQEYLPDELKGKGFYKPAANTREEELSKFLKRIWKGKYGY